MLRCLSPLLPLDARDSASALYVVQVENATSQELAVTVQLVNDRAFDKGSESAQRRREAMGWRWYSELVLESGTAHTVVLPSTLDPRLGLVQVTARTRMNLCPLRQGIGVFFLPWPWSDGRHAWRDRDSEWGWPVLSATIRNEDLHYFDASYLRNIEDDPLSGVLVQMLEHSICELTNTTDGEEQGQSPEANATWTRTQANEDREESQQ